MKRKPSTSRLVIQEFYFGPGHGINELGNKYVGRWKRGEQAVTLKV
jgi:hypothetical protein